MSRNWEQEGFRLPEPQKRKLNKYVEESGKSKQQVLYEHFTSLVEEIELDDPRQELKEVRWKKKELREDMKDIRNQMDDIRDDIDELSKRERELEEKVEEHDTIGATSYDDAVEGIANQVAGGHIKHATPETEAVKQVARDWAKNPEDVVRRVWESDMRINNDDVAFLGGTSYPESDWSRDLGVDRDDAVFKVGHWLERRFEQAEESRKKWRPTSGIVGISDGSYPSVVAEKHGVDVEELVEDAIDDVGVELGDVDLSFRVD